MTSDGTELARKIASYKEYKRKQQEKLLIEQNKLLVKRIIDGKSMIDNRKLEEDFVKSRNYTEMRSNFRPMPVPNFSVNLIPKLAYGTGVRLPEIIKSNGSKSVLLPDTPQKSKRGKKSLVLNNNSITVSVSSKAPRSKKSKQSSVNPVQKSVGNSEDANAIYNQN